MLPALATEILVRWLGGKTGFCHEFNGVRYAFSKDNPLVKMSVAAYQNLMKTEHPNAAMVVPEVEDTAGLKENIKFLEGVVAELREKVKKLEEEDKKPTKKKKVADGQ